MTLRELAQEAGVSISTASKAFRNSKEISPETRDKIFEIAEKHGCFYKYYKKKYEKTTKNYRKNLPDFSQYH